MNELIERIALGQVRHFLTVFFASLATQGFMTGENVEALVAAILTILPIIWSAWSKWQNSRKHKEH